MWLTRNFKSKFEKIIENDFLMIFGTFSLSAVFISTYLQL